MILRFLICLSALLFAMAGCTERVADDGHYGEVIDRIVDGHFAQRGIEPPFGAGSELDLASAYRIQAAVNERLAKRLGARTGFKVGYASKASQEHHGMSEPAYGAVFARQHIKDGGVMQAEDFAHFHIESEIAFVLKSAITEPVQTRAEVAPYVASVHPSLDIPDNRFAGAAGKAAPVDVIASGVGAHRYVLGPGMDPEAVDLDDLILTLSVDGRIAYQGPATSLMGSPWQVLIWIANKRLEHGEPLQAGEVVLTGAVAAAYAAPGAAAAGHYLGDCGALGQVNCTVTSGGSTPQP